MRIIGKCPCIYSFMKRKWDGKRIFHRCVLALLLIAMADFLFQKGQTEEETGQNMVSLQSFLEERLCRQILDTWLPAFSFADLAPGDSDWFRDILGQQSPMFAYGLQETGRIQTESGSIYEKILLQEGESEYTESVSGEDLELPEDSEGRIRLDDETARLLMEENQTGSGEGQVSGNQLAQTEESGFVRAMVRQQEYDWSYYQDFDALIKEFYAVDSTTEASAERINLENLAGTDLTIQKNPDVPQILIYHTHSQETFVDSVPGDPDTSIVGAGELLARILREEYGYNVIHRTDEFDAESRDYAYSNALPVIEQVLKENPTIEVVIDLHRDEMLEGKKLVMDLNGRPTARFMFFNGLSYTKAQGEIDYLQNPYINENLAFSFQMQVLANEYYPDLTRRIYLKGYRYNMHLRPRSLLIELGAQTNTVEEIRNACAPIAHILDMELSGN